MLLLEILRQLVRDTRKSAQKNLLPFFVFGGRVLMPPTDLGVFFFQRIQVRLNCLRVKLPAFFFQEWTYASANLCKLVRERTPGVFRLNDFTAPFAGNLVQTFFVRVGLQDSFK